MASSWDSAAGIASVISLEDILSADKQLHETPVLKLTHDARSRGYDVVCLPLTTERWKKRWSDMCLLPAECDKNVHVATEQRAEAWRSKPSFLRDEVTVTRLDETDRLTVLVSDWLELDATDDWVRHDSEIALQQELAYASYLNIQAAILPPPKNRAHISSYARAVNSCLKNTPYINLSIRLPVYDPSILHVEPNIPVSVPSTPPSRSSLSPSSSSNSLPRLIVPPRLPKSDFAAQRELNVTWELWDVIRSICDYNSRLTLTLDLTPPLPPALGVLGKWAAEPVRYIFLPASTFIANSKGYPVLPKDTQAFIRDSMAHRPTIILSGVKLGLHSRGGEDVYKQYARHLEKTSPVVKAAQKAGTVENFAQGYQDYLQAPLQPLMDNLQSVTYQTFEQDPVKYRHYEEAMYQALLDWPKQDRIVFCIAGAGRGPLVARCLAAIEKSRKKAFVYAVEKNPSAFVTLQGRQEHGWKSKVKVVFGDMRQIDIPEKVDILVSELLGSFGDNELSPECLDGAMRFLKPNGISIPSSYTAHLAPLSSSKLYSEARMSRDDKGVETPYVVMFQAVNILSGSGGGLAAQCGPQVQECWEFEHPGTDIVVNERGLPLTNSHNVRSAKLKFHIPHAGILHGFAGYFEAILYKNVGLSIHPQHKDHVSKDMLSWFPLFFPLKDPLYLPSNSELHASIWRLTNQRQVWYEWYAESFLFASNAPLRGDKTPTKEWSSVVVNGTSPFFSPGPTASPLIDAEDSFPFSASDHRPGRGEGESGAASGSGIGMIKIGQTALHNPGGRSSWMGL